MKLLRQLRSSHLPEYDRSIEALTGSLKDEENIVSNREKAFGDTLRSFAGTQLEGFQTPLLAISDAGLQQASLNKGLSEALHTLPQDLHALHAQEAEMQKRKANCQRMLETADKSEKDYEKQNTGLELAKLGNKKDVDKREVATQAASAKAEADRSAATEEKAALEAAQHPYREKFLESFVTPLVAAIDLRYKAAEELAVLSDKFCEAAEMFALPENDDLDEYRDIMKELALVTVE